MTQRNVLVGREDNRDDRFTDRLTGRRRAESAVHANQWDKSAFDACGGISWIDDDQSAALAFLIDGHQLVIV